MDTEYQVSEFRILFSVHAFSHLRVLSLFSGQRAQLSILRFGCRNIPACSPLIITFGVRCGAGLSAIWRIRNRIRNVVVMLFFASYDVRGENCCDRHVSSHFCALKIACIVS
jgi:hypothetical protein